MNLREWALPVYTILAQMATGALLTLWIVRFVAARRGRGPEIDRMLVLPIGAIWLTILVGLLGSHLHLSMPFLSLLALGNLGSSWLSREVLFTTLFFASLSALTAMVWIVPGRVRLKGALGWFAIVCGLSSVFCMGAIYLLPAQPAWNTPLTVASFFASALQLGIMETAVLLVVDLRLTELQQPTGHAVVRREIVHRSLVWMSAATAAMAVIVILINFALISRLQESEGLAQLSLDLLLGLYLPLVVIRIALPLLGAALLILAVSTMGRTRKSVGDLMTPAYLSCLFILVGEILGRFLFYATHIRVGI